MTFPEGMATVGGRYHYVKTLGYGGAGDVYLVRDDRTEGEFALKLLFQGGPDMASLRKRFVAEARVMAEMQHPHIVQVFDIGDDDGRVYFVMEHAEGGNAKQWFQRANREPGLEAIVGLADHMLSALAFAHGRGVVHRDVKPANLLRFGDRFKLADFGVAKVKGLLGDTFSLTATGDYLGTVGYMAPEQRLDPRRVTPASDVYAAGATLYYLLSRRDRPPPDLFNLETDEILPELSPALSHVVWQATRLDPAERYGDAAEMSAALRQAVP